MKIDGNTGIYDGVIHIFNNNKAKTIFLTAEGTENDKFITLDDCLKFIEHTKKDGVCYVLFDDVTHGTIYQYGNYGEYWTNYGTTQGYA